MTTTIVFGDAHLQQDEEADPAYKLVKSVCKKLKPDRIIDLGDHMDFEYISRFADGKPGLQEGKRLKEDFELLESELKFFKSYTKELVFLSGNHEDRVIKYLQANPVLEGILSISDICKELGIQYVPTNKQPYKLLSDLYVTHGLSFNKYFFAQNAERAGASVIQGHAHRTGSYTYRYPDGRVVTGYGVGTVGPLNPGYTAGVRINGWSSSLGVLYEEGSNWQFDLILITNTNSCIIGGKRYSI